MLCLEKEEEACRKKAKKRREKNESVETFFHTEFAVIVHPEQAEKKNCKASRKKVTMVNDTNLRARALQQLVD